MSADDPIPADVAEAVHQLWDELALLPSSNPASRLKALLAGVGELIDAPHAVWLSAIRLAEKPADDVLGGWRARHVYFYGELDADRALYESKLKEIDGGGRSLVKADESTCALLRNVGEFRAERLVDHVSPAFFDSDFFAGQYASRGIRDRLFVILPVSPDVESYFMFDRTADQPAFDRAALDTAAYALRSLTWLARQLHLSYGQVAATELLTPKERVVLCHLLEGKSRKSIAKLVDQSPNTTHHHIKNIFSKFDVTSQSELLALWISG